MLLSPCNAFARTSQETWLLSVQEIYPVYPGVRLQNAHKTKVSQTTQASQNRKSIQRLRAMQAQSFLLYIRDQYLNLVDAISAIPVIRTSLYLRSAQG
jgi:hypothetical protein